MSLIKKENWWIWLLLFLFTFGTENIVLASILNLYKKDAWYTKWYYWVIASLCLLFPFFIMILVFEIESTVLVSKRLNISGSEIYGTPYTWILCLIVPVIGWALFFILFFYLNIEILIQLKKGILN